jgi:EF-P beta-lysylation protein EpmB
MEIESIEQPRTWQQSLSEAIRDPALLLRRLGLSSDLLRGARQAAETFPLLVPESYLQRMQPGDPRDPLLLQVLPQLAELDQSPGFSDDPLEESVATLSPGVLHKYAGRALLVVTGTCAIHCRYCFRREYPYQSSPRSLDDWAASLSAIESDSTISEVILSGGDPLVLTDRRLFELIGILERMPHLTRLRIHTRLPIVLPQRVTSALLNGLAGSRLQPILVVHANHPREIVGDCADALRQIVRSGVPTLNQAVLLRGINDDDDVLAELSERLINLGVMPYYLHQLDRVHGAAHFEVPIETGRALIAELQARLPGYAVPKYVQEITGDASKRPL